ncbi:MAG: hypothetical protein WBA39_20480 [Rivularia sp. (in: cyanobacteria)]
MNLNKVSAGILVMVSLAITALPASASPYRTSNNIGQRNKVVNVVKSRNVVNVQRRNNQNQFKKVCTTKRVRVRGRIRNVQQCKLVKVQVRRNRR